MNLAGGISEALNGLLDTAVIRTGWIAENGVKLARQPLDSLLPPPRSRQLGSCVGCGHPVNDDDPFLRYRGEYYHAHLCVENQPPALIRRRAPVDLPPR